MFKYAKSVFRNIFPASIKARARRWRSLFLDIWMPIYSTHTNDLTVIQIGKESLDPYIDRLLFGKDFVRKKAGRVFGWNIERAVQKWEKTADLVFFRSSLFRPPITVERRMLVVPYFVDQKAELPPCGEDLYSNLRKLKGRKVKGDLKRVRRARYECEFTCDEGLLEIFYHHIYVPYITERHAESAEIPSWPVFKALYGKKDLLLLRKGNQLVAGAVRQKIGSIYYFLLAGILLNNQQNFLKDGVEAALYWFSFAEAHRLGCLEVDLGSSRPFLKDGVFKYKKKWSDRVAISRYKQNFELFILPCNNSSALHRILENNPFFCKSSGRLIALIFLGQHTVLEENELQGYLKHNAIAVECGEISIILLNHEWASRQGEIRIILDNYTQKYSVLDLSRNLVSDLPGLIYGA